MNKTLDNINILLSGEAGQGLDTMGRLLSKLAKSSGFFVFGTKEIMSRIRGGLNTELIRISGNPKGAFLMYPDMIFSLKKGGLERLANRITPDSMLFFDPKQENQINIDARKFEVDFSKLKGDVKGYIYTGTAIIGYICGLLNTDADKLQPVISEFFVNKEPENNKIAFMSGYEEGKKLSVSLNLKLKTPEEITKTSDYPLLNGSQAVAFGAAAGGCNFISSYPMSPSTGVLMTLAKHSGELDILVEQAEDEISAINMALGAWYAGARALVTTSGGGFALMEEGLSLSGITETPCVLHIAQRPGPGTGLPTRTEQGDLNLVLYAGHGDFPRIIYAPGTPAEAFELTRKAFDIADKYQIPVFILTDQFFVDSTFTAHDLHYDQKPPEHYLVQSDENYMRYAFPQKAGEVSPRSVPGFGKGLVKADSDEHDERGMITEDFEVRVRQTVKRTSKLSVAENDFVNPVFSGNENYENLLVSWGSVKYAAEEALQDFENTAFLHFPQVYPIPRIAGTYFKKAKNIIVIENNFTGQFAEILKQTFNIKPFKILKYNGLPFAVEEIRYQLNEFLKGENQ